MNLMMLLSPQLHSTVCLILKEICITSSISLTVINKYFAFKLSGSQHIRQHLFYSVHKVML